MSSADTLSALGSDLAFSVSYTIASELRSAAVDHEFSDLEVVGALILLSVLLGRSPKIVRVTAKVRSRPPSCRVCVVRQPQNCTLWVLERLSTSTSMRKPRMQTKSHKGLLRTRTTRGR
jgi:hypothetical protein